jgi:hypothetical protein
MNPMADFAPLVQVDRHERWHPMSVPHFLSRSAFYFAEDGRCVDRKIAVGRVLKSQQTVIVYWLFKVALGRGLYSRDAYDANCDYDFEREYYPNQRTRPHDTVDRPRGLHPEEGFYVDLMDWARHGSPDRRPPIYVQRHNEEIDGEPGVSLTYWMLFGMNEPWRRGRPNRTRTHEGDWERFDVLLRRGEQRHEYQMVGIRVYDENGGQREIPRARLKLVAGGRSPARTHVRINSALGSHDLTPAKGKCACLRWKSWGDVRDLSKQLWTGFGGAWGEIGKNEATTGPIGPGKWNDAGFELGDSKRPTHY